MKLKHEDFPSLFQAADSSSSRAQVWYTNLVRLDLILLVLGALLTTFTAANNEIKIWFAIAGAFLLFLAFLVVE